MNTRQLGTSLIAGGLLLPIAGLGFVDGYNPNLGLVGSLSRMTIGSIPYGVVLTIGLLLVGCGTAITVGEVRQVDLGKVSGTVNTTTVGTLLTVVGLYLTFTSYGSAQHLMFFVLGFLLAGCGIAVIAGGR